MAIPPSRLDICLKFICNPYPENHNININPLNWSPKCIKGNCEDCGIGPWLSGLKEAVIDKKLEKMDIKYSQWVREEDGKDKTGNKKTKIILKQEKCNIVKWAI